MKKLLFLLVSALVLLMCVSAWALPINPNRQWGSAATLTELDGVFFDIGSSLNAYGDQESNAIFAPAGAGGSSGAYVAQISWGGGNIEFGIYEYGNTSNTLKLFDSTGLDVGDLVYFEFDSGANYVKSFSSSNTIDQTTYFDKFGFYVENTEWSENPGPYYSEDELNPGDFARMLTYLGQGDSVDIDGDGSEYNDIAHWYIAVESGLYEDANGSAITTIDGDFSDFIVQIESIHPVSEPATMLLLGSCLIALVGISRKRFIKRG